MRPDRFSRDLLAGLWMGLLPVALLAQQPSQRVVALREGLVIHPTAAEAYVMMPEGGIAAVDLGTGATRWTTRAADKPLALVGDLLVGQAAPKTADARNRLELVALNVRKSGAPGVRKAVELAGARVSVGETLEGTFSTSARPSGGDVVVTWIFVPSPKRGMAPEEADENDAAPQPAAAARNAPEGASGAVRMNVSTGALKKIEAPVAAATVAPKRAMPAREIAVEPSLPQYESADGKHLLVSERIADDRVWEKYRWTVYERASKRKLGETRTHVSFTPFVVRGSVLVYETTPFLRAGAEEEPAKLRGVSLETGGELWGLPVGETVWRGPVPP